MADAAKYGTATDFDVDLHSIYAAYLGLFETSGTDWWEKSWGGYFASFGEFLGFGWEVMVVVDAPTGRAHVAVRRDQIALFAKMIRTRFGESLPKDPPTTLPLTPHPTRTLSLRRLLTIHDLASYRKLSLTLPAAELSYLRQRVRAGEVAVAEQLFYAGGSAGELDRGAGAGGSGVRDNGVGYTWACVRTTWWEKGGGMWGLIPGQGRVQPKGGGGGGGGGNGGKGLVLEVGMAVVRCANLRAVNVWPPVPEENYRKSHFITEEWVDKRANVNPPSYPRAYAFGKSHYVAEKDIERIVDATVSALASQENDSQANTLILLTAGEPCPLPVASSSTLPSNILHLDVLALEHNLLRRAQEEGIPGTPDRHAPLPSLSALLQVLQIPVPPFAPLGNAGNEAFYTVLAFQKLVMAETRIPELLFSQPAQGVGYGYPGMAFPDAYGGTMAPPLAPFAQPPGHSRRSSGSSARHSQAFLLPVSQNSSPRSTGPSQSFYHPSEETRARPVSMGDAYTVPLGGSLRRPKTPDDQRGIPESSSGMTPKRATLPRSQTVYWDDMEYSEQSVRDKARGSRLGLPRRSTDGLASSGVEHEAAGTRSSRGRTSGQTGIRASMGPSSFRSRSVSWHDDEPSGRQQASAPRMDKRSSAVPAAGNDASSAPTSPARSRPGAIKRQEASSSSLSRVEASGGSTNESSETRSREGTRAREKSGEDKGKKEGKEGKGEKKKEGKLKSERSARNLAGALSRFWVG